MMRVLFCTLLIASSMASAQSEDVTWIHTDEPAQNKDLHPFFTESKSVQLLDIINKLTRRVDVLEKRVAVLEKEATGR